MATPPRPQSGVRRFLRWWGDAISHAGLMVGSSRAFSQPPEAGGSEKYLGTAMGIDEARRRSGGGENGRDRFD